VYYEVGDIIIFRANKLTTTCVVEARNTNLIDGKPGFIATTDTGERTWGYDTEIIEAIPRARDADRSAWFDEQHDHLNAALTFIRKRYPNAAAVELVTSDECGIGRGFELDELLDRGGKPVPVTPHGEDWLRLYRDVQPHLHRLQWGGIVGEDRRGYATIRL